MVNVCIIRTETGKDFPLYKMILDQTRKQDTTLLYYVIPFIFVDATNVLRVIMVMRCLDQNMTVNDAVALCRSKAIIFHPVVSS